MAIDYQRLAIPKPEPRGKLKARLERQHAILREAARKIAYDRAGGCCEACGTPLKLNPSDEGADWYNVANVHEITPRSLGGSDIDERNLRVLCARDHQVAHGQRVS